MKKAIALGFATLVIAGIAIVAGPRAEPAKQDGKNPPQEGVYGPAELSQREKRWAESLTRLEHTVDAKTFETMRAVWKAHLDSRAALERAGAVDTGFYRKQCEGIDRLIGLLEKLPHSTVSEAGPAPAKQEAKDATQAERVAQITRQLSRAGKLPGELVDAHFAGEQTGDGQLGPSDFAAFYALAVAPADLPAWRAALSKSKTWNRFANDEDIRRAAPKPAQPWWVSGTDSGALEFYSPHSLTGSANGWVGIAADGRIFVYVLTM